MLKGVRHCVARSCRGSNASHILACEIKAEDGSYDSLDEESKKGPCWSALRRAGMTQWTSSQQVMSDTSEQHDGNKLPIPSSIFENKYEKDEVEHETALAGTPIVTQESRKRKHFLLGEVDEVKPARLGKQRQNGKHTERRQVRHVGSSKDRWSAERYALAEKSMLEILKAEGAVFGNPISRPALRVAARKRIGDTGLLDHLLKHIDGKVAPGGAERFRRWHNTDGVMEYWLESADLVDIRRQARVQDPYWTPPPSYDGGCPPQEDSVHIELKLLRAEIAKMKNEMEETASMKQKQDQAKQIELEQHKELAEWKAKTEQHLIGISSSLNGIQNMYRELATWKTKTEQQLAEISNALSTVQASKQCNVFSPSASERWEDWLEGTNLDTVPEDDLAPWLGSNDSVNAVQGAAVQGTSLALPPQLKAGDSPSQDFVCAKELELLKEEMAKMKRDVQGLVPKKHEEDQANLTPDSSAITTSKADLDSPFLLFQEMCNELVKWKANMEQQLMEVTSCVNSMQASNQVGHHTLNVSSFERWK